MKKYIPSIFSISTVLLMLILFYWGKWIFNSGFNANEFGNAINPIINLVTIFFLYLNWKSMKEEINETKRVNRKQEGINIGAMNIAPIKNGEYLMEQIGRGGDFDPLGGITLKIKNFGYFPTYLEEIKLFKIDSSGNEEVYKNAGRFIDNLIFPGVEIEGRLNIWAPNKPNSEYKGVKIRYELVFRNETEKKILKINLSYIGLITEKKELWYVPYLSSQEIVSHHG